MSARRRAAVVVLAVPLLLSACGGDSSAESSPDLAKVTYLTSFNTFGRDAYAYVAAEKGFFEEAGFDVEIKPGTGSGDVMKLIAGGQADYGVADFSAVAVALANQDLPLTSVGMIHQQSLAALVTLEGTGISEPADLAGKTIADQAGSTVTVLFPAYAKAAGFDGSGVKFVPSAPPSLPQLLASGKVDAVGQFVVGKGLIEAAAKDREAVFLPYSDVLPDLYGNTLLTTTETAESNPEQVQKFSAALLKGLQYSIENPDETGEILAAAQPTQDAAVAAGEVKLMAPYVTGEDGAAIGAIDEARVQGVIDELTKGGAITKDVTPADLVSFDLTPPAEP
ncbi:ABC transporter substrate-binding protein [Kineosporia babensis]|uniref:Thiamine pyrimidine synthase n=1 Tax=Kineosporia babensis TaxID=499548 RepID=A0A9X1ST49_9ACTN|nr:ABC transporter substrate-binding protein [Kineosporia babensis]MCD5310961.1 ABC transporter substrate-binding protein [Kineosporia babensis]